MISFDEYQKRKAVVEEARREADRATGAREQTKKRLKDDFGCATVADAEKELARIEKELKAADKECERVIKEFDEEEQRAP